MAQKRLLEPYSREKEKQIQDFWKKAGIPQKAREAAFGKKPYYFMDGPPYATGHIHMGTALNKILKDVSIRSRRMMGFDVFDRPGYDCHGVPTEIKVEQKHGFKRKADIEKFGVKKFIGECRHFATEFIGVMNEEFNNLGVWMDWDNSFLTLSRDYIDSVWWTFKQGEEKGFLAEGVYPVHVCPHCETVVSFNEIEYSRQTDRAVFVKFRALGQENTHFIIWTTTPWTLPGNTGIMVNPKFDYAFVKMSSGETWVIAAEKVQGLMDAIEAGFSIQKTVKGKELGGMRYSNPLSKNLKLQEMENAYRVVLSERYVNLEEGTGLVHLAPGHGKEDFEVGQKNRLPTINPVGMNGTLRKEAGKYAGKKARAVDKEIISDLEEMHALVFQHDYTHDYPLCWRCKSPLLMLALPQHFFRVEKIRKKMIELNKEVNWVPKWMQRRMHDWLQNLGDWPLSRARYWGTPIPVWKCRKCGNRRVFGSLAELENESGKKIGDAHKPMIDEIELECKCSGRMVRVPEILDVWFDAGASSWAALGYPAKKELFERFWPADLNWEGTDQFRGWWNAELILSTIAFGKKPFKNIVVHGIVLDLEKKKMSKSLGNIVSPKEVIEKYNTDFLRYYLVLSSRGEDFAFDWGAFRDIARFFNVLHNCYNYAGIYLGLNLPFAGKEAKREPEDEWVLSRLNSLASKVIEAYNNYAYFRAGQAIEDFVVEDLSRTYIKLVRDRADASVNTTMGACLDTVLRLLAPIAPHITEYIYQSMRRNGEGDSPESVHLLEMPLPDKRLIKPELEKEMEKAKEIVQAALALREQQKLRRRWPLKELVIVSEADEFKRLKGIIARACNVKEVVEKRERPAGNFATAEVGGGSLFLNIEADGELRDEWELHELRRKIQGERKKQGLVPQQEAELIIASSDDAFLKKHQREIEKDTNTRMVISKQKEGMEKLLERSFSIQLKSL
jgi:isoleucyl-tRNA synthetase